jgi:MFS family permease
MIKWLAKEGKVLMASKTIRVFAYGFFSIALPFYLKYLNYSALFIGIVITLAIIFNVFYNLVVSKYADKLGRGVFLQIFSLFMVVSSFLFLLQNVYSIILASMLGIISVTGTETGPFLSIEQSALTKFSPSSKRTLMFSIYNFLGYGASSIGSLFAGLPFYFFTTRYAFYFIIITYGIVGFILFLLYFLVGNKLELETIKKLDYHIDTETKKIILMLSLLFSIDALGGGFIVQSIIALWLNARFHVGIGLVSLIFFVGGIITAISFFAAEWIARKIGLLKTMVLTHLISNVFLILVAFSNILAIAVAFLFLRQSVSQMDVPTRQSYIMAIVKPEDRTSTSSITNVSRGLSQGMSPYLSTYAISISAFYAPFLFSGIIKIVYDVLIYLKFKDIKPPEEKT